MPSLTLPPSPSQGSSYYTQVHGPPNPIWDPSCPDRSQGANIDPLRPWSLAAGTPPHQNPLAAPDQRLLRCTAAMEKDSPDPLCRPRGKAGRHRQHRPGFARRHLPAAAMEGGGCERSYRAPCVVLVINDNPYGLMVTLSYMCRTCP
jgi:hypothetical protein